MDTTFGSLTTVPALERPDLLADPVREALLALGPAAADDVRVAEIDPDLADTAAMSEAYGLDLAISANCVVVAGRRGGEERLVACVVLATTRADVNTVVRKKLDVRKASFAPTDVATERSGMAYGGITPIGVPAEWPVWVDGRVHAAAAVCVGSGVRHSKLFCPGALLATLPGAEVVEGLAR